MTSGEFGTEKISCAIVRTVVDDYDLAWSLQQQRRQALSDQVATVPRRDHHRDAFGQGSPIPAAGSHPRTVFSLADLRRSHPSAPFDRTTAVATPRGESGARSGYGRNPSHEFDDARTREPARKQPGSLWSRRPRREAFQPLVEHQQPRVAIESPSSRSGPYGFRYWRIKALSVHLAAVEPGAAKVNVFTKASSDVGTGSIPLRKAQTRRRRPAATRAGST